MTNIIDWHELLVFWQSVSFMKIIRLFWYFFILEFPRYLMMDFIILLILKRKSQSREDRKAEAREALYRENPLISIIVPGKNEGKHIFKLVKSIGEQTYRNFELIVIDDGSDDDTETICRSLYENGMIDKFLRNEVRGGKASAANFGLRFAKGKYVVHLDADSSFDRDAMEKILLPFYMHKKVGGVGGNVKIRNYKTSLATRLQAIEYLQTISVGRIVTSYLGIYRVISGAFGAFRKDLLDRLGGWDIGPGLDGDITVKIRKMGYKIHFQHEAVCLTSAPDDFTKLAKQRLRWSKSLIRFRLRKHKDIYFPNAHFNLSNFLSFAENTFYNLVLDILWIVYIFDLVFNQTDLLGYIIPLKVVFYVTSSTLQFIIVLLLSERGKEELKLLPYVPLMFVYNGLYMRFVRTLAYIKEIYFFSSYQDPWNPEKSSQKAYDYGL